MLHPSTAPHGLQIPPSLPWSSSPSSPASVHSSTLVPSSSYAFFLSLLDQTHSKTQSLTHAHARSIHAQILKHSLQHNVNLTLRLHALYHPSPAARALLLSLPKPNLLTWNVLISSLSPALALHHYSQMLSHAFLPDEFTLPSVLNACATLSSLSLGRAVHAHAIITGLTGDPYVTSALITMYAACGLADDAERVLQESPERDLAMWNAALTGLARQGAHCAALRVLARMLESGAAPNRTTLSGAATACGRAAAPRLGRAVHARAVKSGADQRGDVSVNSALVFMYARCGNLGAAARVFRAMPERNVVAWNSIISAHAQGGAQAAAWDLFIEMLQSGCEPSEATLTSMLTAVHELTEGKMLHGYILKLGLAMEEIVGAAIIDMYVRRVSLVNARTVFDEIPRTEMGSWNSLILGYAKNGHPKEALGLFYRLRDEAGLRPNSITLVGALSACSALGAIREGKAIHEYIIGNGIKMDLIIGTALIDMYSKCGNVEMVRELFEEMKEKDLVAWSVMISGYGINGQASEAMELFDRMKDDGLKPDHVTFTSVLSACSHAGLVQEGWDYFHQMKTIYGLEPKNEQYACMVDLLGRAGKLDEALDFIKRMPIKPDTSVWGALLGACRIHKNVELGAYAAEKLFALDPKDPGYYVLLSNLYASTGKWMDATRVRELMKSRGMQKPPGCSWVELGGTLHEFYVGDKSHPQSKEIYEKLDELGEGMRGLGYVPDTNLVLHDVDDEIKKEKLSSHSERLAIAFGLISTQPNEPIRVTKNLRVCADCHHATKLISKITGRRIVVRDARRFHHFENGECSCGEYW